MESNRIDPDREYTSHDLKTAGLGISGGGLLFGVVAYVFAMSHATQAAHAAWFFGFTGFFILSMGIGTLIAGLKKHDQGDSNTPNDSPSASTNPESSTNTKL